MELVTKKLTKEKELGIVSQKVLLLLQAGLALGLSGTPTRYFKILKEVGEEWKDLERRALHRAIKSLYESKLIDTQISDDGVVVLKLNKKGKKKVLKYELFNMEIPKMIKWDGKWRIVLFDIPEKDKKDRDALRYHLKKLRFFEYQKSVFAHPFDCKNEIDFLIEFYNIRPYVRFMIVESMDNDLHLRKHFNLQ
ncbi:hypothetical protein ACFLZC_03105 [Patescibacteria group bacterium]